MPFEPDATMRAARILIDQDPGPGDRLDAFLLLTGLEFHWRRDGPGADFTDAVRRYEALSGRTLPKPASAPSFGIVKWRGAERCVTELALADVVDPAFPDPIGRAAS